jgi:hypothetical protein
LFAAQSERISADDVFALSDEMRRYLSANIVPEGVVSGQVVHASCRNISSPSRPRF